MRLTADQIKSKMLDSDQEVRSGAVEYFARSCSTDPSVMALVIQAFDKFGLEAFESFWVLDDLVHTDESVAWLCQQVDTIDDGASDSADEFFGACVGALRHAGAAALQAHEEQISSLEELDDDSKQVIANRLRLSRLSPPELWQELRDFCRLHDGEEYLSENESEFGNSLADALSAFPDACAAEVHANLESTDAAAYGWLELLSVRMAGNLRLEQCTAKLIDCLYDAEWLACEEAFRALKRIGTDAVVEEAAARSATVDWGVRLAIAELLQHIPTDLSVETCLRLAEQELDVEVRGTLIGSALLTFSSSSIEPARQFLHSTPKTPETLEVRDELFLAAKMLDVRFPEYEEWVEDSRTDYEFCRQWYEERSYFPTPDDLDDDDGLEDDFDDGESLADDEFDDDFADVAPGTIVREEPKIGRNDPCPCGSGKKYKKCCLHKHVG